MSRPGDFSRKVKLKVWNRQDNLCAWCGVKLVEPGSSVLPDEKTFYGEAHHFQPLDHGGSADEDNCVYLCYADHKLHGHGMAPFGIDKQGGSSKTWVMLRRSDFPYWNGDKSNKGKKRE
jgi:hypothetical protein